MHPTRRTWHGTGARRTAEVESLHPVVGWLTRGWIRRRRLADATGPGPAGHLIWSLQTGDHIELEPVTGDYLSAERALLDATTALEE